MGKAACLLGDYIGGISQHNREMRALTTDEIQASLARLRKGLDRYLWLQCNLGLCHVTTGRALSNHSLLKEPLLTRDNQEQFLRLLAAIREKLTSSHVIAEIQGRVNSVKLYGYDRLSFWPASIDLLMQWRLDEQLSRLLDITSRQEMLPDIGVVDTGLIELAARNNCVVINEDEETLARRAWTEQIDCRLVKQLIPQV